MFTNNLPAFTPDHVTPKLVASGANNLYIGIYKKIIRILPVADIYVAFSQIGDGATVASATTGPLLKANQEYFIDCGDYKSMTASLSTADVTLLLQEGSVRY
jgi:hypothetical protein